MPLCKTLLVNQGDVKLSLLKFNCCMSQLIQSTASSLIAAIAQLRGHKHTSFSRWTGLGDDVSPVAF